MIHVFGTYALDTDRRELRRGEASVLLEPKVFELLSYLIQHHSYFVSRDELYAHLWPRQFVSEAALTYCIAEARKAVGDNGRVQRMIKTVYGRGYRFVAPVEEPQSDSAPTQAVPSPSLLPSPELSPAASQSPLVPLPTDTETMDNVWAMSAIPQAERRQLTVLWCQWGTVSHRASAFDLEEFHHVLQDMQSVCDPIIQRFDGWMAQHFGDGFVVYFGHPHGHEDNAHRAVHTALELLESTRRMVPELRRRSGVEVTIQVGIHTGMVVISALGSGERRTQSALGETPHRAARLATLATPNTVVVSAATWQLIAGYFLGRALNMPNPDNASEVLLMYQVLQESVAQSRLDVACVTGLTAFVGREHELGLLHERWTQSQEGWGQAVLLSGEAGIGKSRLVRVFQDSLAYEAYSMMEARCSPYVQQSPLYPIGELVQRWLQWRSAETPEEKVHKLEQALTACGMALEEAVPIFAALCSLPLSAPYVPLMVDPQHQKPQTFATLLAWLGKETERQPVCLLLEDLQWGDPFTLEFLHLLLAQLPLLRLLLVLTCRPEFTPPWTVRSHITHIVLGRLTAAQSERMIERVTVGKALPPEVQEPLLAKANGVPLFIEELTKMVLESGLVKEKEQHYELTEPMRPLEIPATLQDSLMARLDKQGVGKGIAQLGATLGREFSYEVLHAIAPLNESTLQHGLEQLVQAEILYQRGLPPQAQYVFKHALIQEVAYQSLLRSTRQEYHGHIAQVLEERFPETCVSLPELVAYHYTEAGLRATAVGYWQSAGLRAIERSAYVEAIAHLQQGLTLLEAIPGTPERLQHELTLSIALGIALMVTQGSAVPEVERACIRACQCARQAKDSTQLFTALRGLWLVYLARCELQTAYAQAKQLLRLARQHPDPALLLEAHLVVGTSRFFQGEFPTAWTHLEQGIALYDASQHHALLLRYGQDPGPGCVVYTAWLLWLQGYPDRAIEHIRTALALAEQCKHPLCLVYVQTFAVLVHHCRREPQEVFTQIDASLKLASQYRFSFFVTMGMVFRGWALVVQGHRDEGLQQLHQGIADHQASGTELFRPSFLGMLAEAYAMRGDIHVGLEILEEALALVEFTGERLYEAELYRLKGELLLRSGAESLEVTGSNPHAATAEELFRHALSLARHQRAKAWELRVVISLSRLWQQQGKPHQARNLLQAIYGWFSEGFATGDLDEARRLLEELQ